MDPRRRRLSRSRYGCRNCKLRKLKCDETKPHCNKCRAYGVLCNFEHNVRDLQSLTENKAADTPTEQRVVPLRVAISDAIWSTDGLTCLVLDPLDQALFKRYRDRTLPTFGGQPMMDEYQKHALHAAFRHPCLLHGMLAVAAVHDRYLGTAPSDQRRSLREVHHWSQCTVLFAKMLRGPIKDEERKDACWATASTLGILSFSSTDIDPTRRQQPWPLAPQDDDDDADLEWLRLGAGKMKLWQLLNPLRPQSAFKPMARVLALISQPLPSRGARGIPPAMARLCGMHDLSTPGANPYFGVAHSLSQLLAAQGSQDDAYGAALRVSGQMGGGGFERLLRRREPTALVLLCMWYERARQARWWIDMRARYEYAAIRSFLQRYHGDNVAVRTLLT